MATPNIRLEFALARPTRKSLRPCSRLNRSVSHMGTSLRACLVVPLIVAARRNPRGAVPRLVLEISLSRSSVMANKRIELLPSALDRHENRS